MNDSNPSADPTAPAHAPLPKRGTDFTATIEGVAFGGRGLARFPGGGVAFIEKSLPGDVVKARVLKRKPNYVEAYTLEVLQPSVHRTAAPCPVFGTCGGCKWQSFEYEQQLAAKSSHVEEALRHLGGARGALDFQPIIPSPDSYRYRNKMEFAFGYAPGRRDDPEGIEIGLHKPGDFRNIVPVASCLLQSESMDAVLGAARVELRRQALRQPALVRPYDLRHHNGFLRHLVLRRSVETGRWMAALITASAPWEGATEFADALMAAAPGCAGVLWGTNDGLSDVARAEHIPFQAGPCVLDERLGTLSFRLSPFSFFQTNTRAAELLYDTVRDFAALTGSERVLDAYCGTGTIGLYLAPQAREVVGIELVAEAVEDARHNAERNSITNAVFHAGDMGRVLQEMYGGGPAEDAAAAGAGPFDLVVMDPPRGGMDKRALHQLIALRPQRFLYVSCNPATLGRDTAVLREAGYEPVRARALDMFPQTFHVEGVVEFVQQTPDAQA